MSSTTLKGRVQAGHQVASQVMPESVMEVIREKTGFPGLRSGTLNVTIGKPHFHRRDYTLFADDRPDRYDEAWYFELCRISRRQHSLRALILSTANNHWGDCVLEIMAGEQLRTWLPVSDHDEVEVTIFASFSEALQSG